MATPQPTEAKSKKQKKNKTAPQGVSADKQFPRTRTLPTQSPLYWVEQKDRYLRQLLIRDIEATTNRRLIVYYANRYENAQIDPKDIAYMAELLGDVGKEPIDLLLETIGGYTDATEGLVSLLRNNGNDVRVIVAAAAKSNGTLLALAANKIAMGATSELGPIEPLVNGIPCTILEQPQVAVSNFSLHMFGKYALSQTRALAKTLLAEGMMKGKPQNEIDATVDALSSRNKYFSHGSVIDHREAKALGLAVEYLDPENELWQRLWLLFCVVEYDCRKSRYLKLFEGRARSTAVSVPPSSAPAQQTTP